MANKKLYTCGSGIDLLKSGFKFWAWKREEDLSLSDYRLTVPEEAIVEIGIDTYQIDPTNHNIKYSQVKRLPKKVTAEG
jgi:hypothetical protein